jgi:hypothetical protein
MGPFRIERFDEAWPRSRRCDCNFSQSFRSGPPHDEAVLQFVAWMFVPGPIKGGRFVGGSELSLTAVRGVLLCPLVHRDHEAGDRACR